MNRSPVRIRPLAPKNLDMHSCRDFFRFTLTETFYDFSAFWTNKLSDDSFVPPLSKYRILSILIKHIKSRLRLRRTIYSYNKNNQRKNEEETDNKKEWNYAFSQNLKEGTIENQNDFAKSVYERIRNLRWRRTRWLYRRFGQ